MVTMVICMEKTNFKNLMKLANFHKLSIRSCKSTTLFLPIITLYTTFHVICYENCSLMGLCLPDRSLTPAKIEILAIHACMCK